MRIHKVLASVGAGALAASGLIVGGANPAAMAVAPTNPAPSCVASDTADHLDCTVSYNSTGAEQTFVVPAGVTSIDVELVGGRGGEERL